MFLTDAQLKAELQRCEFCEEKPCKGACPCDCSPADFIMAARGFTPADFKRSAGIILSSNPLGGVCGAVCPDYHCQAKCSHEGFDTPINIPAVQATIIKKAKEFGKLPEFILPAKNGKRIAVIGAGPAGIASAVVLIQLGYEIEIFETEAPGGQTGLIPEERLEKHVLDTDLAYVIDTFKLNLNRAAAPKASELLSSGYTAVIIATGLSQPIHLNIPGDEYIHYGMDFLKHPNNYDFTGKRIALVGGAIAADQALTAVKRGAEHVELICLESYPEMPLTPHEKQGLHDAGVSFTNRTRITELVHDQGSVKGIRTKPVILPKGETFHPSKIVDEPGATDLFRPFDMLIVAIGNRPVFDEKGAMIYHCGDMANGPTTVVEAVASGKNAALTVDAAIRGQATPEFTKAVKSCTPVLGWKKHPVPLTTDFFGRTIESPFLLSAAPPSDGYEQMKKAYLAGWSGGVMKTAFDSLDIHIPGEYMFVFNEDTYGNCDNVSEHPLDRVCSEIERLVREFPEKLTMASTGGPVTGNDAEDMLVWQSNTRKLEQAGAMGIEYSLSCPQGGDGTHGDIVAQDAVLSAKIIDWVLQISDSEIPKLFKLTGAVTAIWPIVDAVRKVFAKYPGKKAGITLANTFPTLAFRHSEIGKWDEGVIVGMSGAGVLPISYLTLSRAGKMGVYISGNGGAMNYLDAANMLALGASSVQFCTIAEKYGIGIIDELKSGLSHLLEARGLGSVKELTGIAQPDSVTDFMDLPPKSKHSALIKELCLHCGNCTRCPYLAISLDEDKLPVIDKDLCVGCSLCVQKCFTGALFMESDETPKHN
ncbi:MAG TPA: FAD-dependent oxidoreductase [Candidatus Cloacimonadota bacterium]|nr:FAD-dependent oxidoreductase [Candidatus Cloacimonadota bacterium]